MEVGVTYVPGHCHLKCLHNKPLRLRAVGVVVVVAVVGIPKESDPPCLSTHPLSIAKRDQN